MSEERPPHEGSPPPGDPPPHSQEVRHSQVSALVPKGVARGVFSTGAVVLQGQHEFIIDFLLRMTMPHQVAARIVMTPSGPRPIYRRPPGEPGELSADVPASDARRDPNRHRQRCRRKTSL